MYQEMHYKKDWEEEYKRNIVSAEEAVKVVKSGDYVIGPLPMQATLLERTLCERKDELRDVTFVTSNPVRDPGWFSPGMEESFTPVITLFIGALTRIAHDARISTYLPSSFSTWFKTIDEERPEKRDIDVFITPVSTPDKNGFCYFGPHMWHKRSYAKRAKKVIVEVDPSIPKMCGDNAIHVSEIDYFVENPSLRPPLEFTLKLLDVMELPPERRAPEVESLRRLVSPEMAEQLMSPEMMEPLLNMPAISHERRLSVEELMRRLFRRNPDMAGLLVSSAALPILADESVDLWRVTRPLGVEDAIPEAYGIAENLKEIIQDRDSFNIGVGRPSLWMVELGVFDEKHDIGIYTEMGAPGMCLLVKREIATGKYQTFHPGKAIFSTFTGCGSEDIEFAAENPAFEMHDSEYVVNIPNVVKVENMVAINNGLQVDLTGQICSETQFGPRMINGQGGQLEMHIGAFSAKGGRACTLLPSTALGGSVSTIVPQLEKGSLVTIQRHFADIIVTEHGIARLAGKNHRERAGELIGVAHPDFRAELKKEAQKLFYP
jgi:4-hydroxybutyrate CoA-transferase